MAQQPGSIANVAPRGDDWIVRELADLRREIAELRGARRLEAATMDAGTLTVSGTAVVESADYAAGTSGWRLSGDGTSEFNGSA